MGWRGVVIAAFLGFIAIQSMDALACFQCADTQLNTACYSDYQGLVNTSLGKNDTYKKNCTTSNSRWDRCVIETHIADGGKYTLFKRGCHDGEYFNTNVDDKEFHNLTANNFTTCAYPKNKLVCFTFCNSGDYCNGPQPVIDQCDLDWTNKTMPDGLVCGGSGIHDNTLVITIVCNLMLLFVALGFCNRQEPYDHRDALRNWNKRDANHRRRKCQYVLN